MKSFDDAHNVSGEVSYFFYVAPNVAGEGATKLEAENLAPGSTSVTGAGNYAYTESLGSLVSNNSGVHLVAPAASAASPQRFNFKFTANTDADYALGAQLVTAHNFGVLRFALDGAPLLVNGAPVNVDTYSAIPRPSTPSSVVLISPRTVSTR